MPTIHDFKFSRFSYAGIGMRGLNAGASYIFMRYACAMVFYGGLVRSGSADGSDTSFETGAKIGYDAITQLIDGLKPGEYGHVLKSYLPWNGFNGRWVADSGYTDRVSAEAAFLASIHHPGWNELKDSVKGLMARNVHQILGDDLSSPVRFTMCQTADGAFTAETTSGRTGGTGQAIRIAGANGVKVYNTKNPDHLQIVMKWLETAEVEVMTGFGVSPKALVDSYLDRFRGIKKTAEGDILTLFGRGDIDVLVHGCNLQYYNSGIAKSIREQYPEAYKQFKTHKVNDRKLLGTIDVVPISMNGREQYIVNAYTQPIWGREPDILYVDYEAVRKCFKAVASRFDTKQKIGIPRIGSGLGNGCWVTLSNAIGQQLRRHDLTLVDFPRSPESELGITQQREKLDGSQLDMF